MNGVVRAAKKELPVALNGCKLPRAGGGYGLKGEMEREMVGIEKMGGEEMGGGRRSEVFWGKMG